MRASARTPSGAAMQVLAMHAGFTTPLRSVSARPRPNRRVVTRASQDDCARPGGSASSPNRRANQKGASSPVRERSVSRAHGGTVPSAGARSDAHAKAPRLASVRDAAWSSVATGVTYGDGETRLSRAQLRAGLRARKALREKRGALVPSASKTKTGGVFARDVCDDVANVEVATTSRRRRAQTFDPANNAVVKRGGETRDARLDRDLSTEIRFETFGEAFAAEASAEARLASRDAIESTELNPRSGAESRDFEYRDAGGEPFTVNLTNVGSPKGLTTIKLKGVDRANLLGALCSALAKAEVSVVSGSIQTDRRTGAVRNTMHVCDSETGERLDPRVFEWLSVRVLSACWTADERAWLATPRSVGRFIVAKGRSRVGRAQQSARRNFADLDSASNPRRIRDRAEDAEAKMRACSARLADAVERADREGSVREGSELFQLLDGDTRALLRDVEDAAAESFAARSALEAFSQTKTPTPRAVSGFSTAPAPLEREERAFFPREERLEAFLERHSAFDTFDEEDTSGRTEKENSAKLAEVFSSASSAAARATLAAATAADDASSIRTSSREDAHFLDDTSATSLKSLFADAYDGVSPFFKGVFFMNVASCLFGTNQVVIKQVADAGVDDFTQMFLRFAVAAVPLVPFIYQGAKGSNSKELLRGATHLGTILAVGYFLQIIGLEGTTSAKGALTSTFTVLSVPVFAGLAGQRVPWFTWPASVAAMVGVGLLTGGDGSPFVAGDAVCILSAIIFGYHTLTSSKYARLFEDQELPFISFQIGVVAAESGLWKLGEMGYRGFREHAANGFAISNVDIANVDIAAFITHTSDVAAHLPWPALLWMGLATTSFTLWIEFLALKNVSASTCALIYTAEPLWGALFAWHFMGDRWGPAGWLGAALIVGASVGSQVLTFDEDDAAEAKAEAERAVAQADAMHDENFARY